MFNSLWVLFAASFINVNYIILKIINNKPYSNIVLCFEVLVYMEEWINLMGDSETRFEIPDYSGVIDGLL